jgi:hypothetical protein
MFTQESVSAVIVVAGGAWLLMMWIAIYVLRGCYISPDEDD